MKILDVIEVTNEVSRGEYARVHGLSVSRVVPLGEQFRAVAVLCDDRDAWAVFSGRLDEPIESIPTAEGDRKIRVDDARTMFPFLNPRRYRS